MRAYLLLLSTACGASSPGDGIPIATDQPVGFSLAIDTASAYWTTEWAVQSVGLDGSSVSILTMLPPQNSFRPQIAVDATTIYWTEAANADGTSGALMTMPIAGGSATELASGAAMHSVAVDADHVFFTTSSAIMMVAKSGGPPTVLASASEPYRIVVDRGTVFWTSVGDWRVMSVPSAGGQPTVLVEDPGAMYLAVDESDIYIAENSSNGSILKVPRGGGAAQEIVKLEDIPSEIAVDASHVYWGTQQRLRRAGLGGGGAETIAENRGLTRGLVLDDQYIYWATDGLAIDQKPGIAKLEKPP